MPLLSLPKRQGVNEKKVLEKVKSKKSSTMTLKLGKDSLLTVISNMKAVVESKLGKYKERYQLVNKEEEYNAYIDAILENGICSFDTETTGLNCFKDKLVGASFYTPSKLKVVVKQKPIYVPLAHISYITNDLLVSNLDINVFAKGLKRLADAKVKIIFHNAKFDYKMVYNNLGIKLPIFYDTMLAGRAIDNTQSASLKFLYAKYVEQTDEFSKFSDLFDGIPFQYVPLASAYIYGAKDAEMTYELYVKFQEVLEKLPKVKWVIENIEIPCIMATVEMELNGVLIDKPYADSLFEKYNKLLEESKEETYKQIEKYRAEINAYKRLNPNNKLSEPINLASPTQLAILLYDVLKVISPSKKEPRGTGEEIIKTSKLPFIKPLLEYRANQKLISTYITAIPNQVEDDGRIHCLFNQYGTDTGRYSSSEPNLQNIPSHNTDIRPMFTVPENYCLIGSDFSQQEVRLMAGLCKDENMIKAYKEGKDIYAWVASLIYKMPYEECKEFRPDGSTNKEGKQRRSHAKAIVLGINYSKGAKSIAEDLGITEQEAQNIYDTFFREFPKVKEFISKVQGFVRRHGYTETLFGRRRQIPDMMLEEYEFTRTKPKADSFDPLNFTEVKALDYSVSQEEKNLWINKIKKAWGFKAKNEVIESAKQEGLIIKENTMKIADAERQCVNAVVQGTAGDQTKLALISLVNNQELKELGFKLLLTVHDEILGECPIQNAKRCGEILTYTMAHSIDDYLDMNFKCDAEFTKSWYGNSIEIE